VQPVSSKTFAAWVSSYFVPSNFSALISHAIFCNPSYCFENLESGTVLSRFVIKRVSSRIDRCLSSPSLNLGATTMTKCFQYAFGTNSMQCSDSVQLVYLSIRYNLYILLKKLGCFVMYVCMYVLIAR
jgi:hypothetical protein